MFPPTQTSEAQVSQYFVSTHISPCLALRSPHTQTLDRLVEPACELRVPDIETIRLKVSKTGSAVQTIAQFTGNRDVALANFAPLFVGVYW